MIAESIAGGEVWDVKQARSLLRQTYGGDLWLGENDFSQEAIVHFPQPFRVGRVVGSDFALLHRQVHNLIRAGAVTGGENVRHAGAHVRICDDATGLQPHAKPLKAEPSDVWATAEAEEDFFSLDADLLLVMRESDFFLGRHATGVEQTRTGIKLDALAAKHGF